VKAMDPLSIARGCIVTSGTLLKAGFAVICGKIAAVALGPSEFGSYGQYLLIITMLQGISSLGLANAHVVYFAKNADEDSLCTRRRAAYSLALLGGVSVATFTVAVLYISDAFVSDMPTVPIWLLAVVFLYCTVTPVVVAHLAELNASGRLASQQLLAISTSLVQMCVLLFLVHSNSIKPPEAAAAYCAGFILVGLPLAIIHFRCFNAQTVILARAWQHYSKFVIPGLSVPLIASLATITAFNVIKSRVFPEDAGVWFALWRLSEAYHGIIIAIGATLFLPQLAIAGIRIKAVAVKLFLVMLCLYIPWSIALLCWPENTIALAFSSAFSTHLPNLFPQVVGDVFKIVCSTCILVYIGISLPRAVVAGEVIFGLLFVSLLAFGIQGQGLGRCLEIYAISYALLSLLMVVSVAFLLQNRNP
jgi:O-antigen/teichoic acid export membrane protein